MEAVSEYTEQIDKNTADIAEIKEEQIVQNEDITELNAMLDNLFPKQSYTGEFITAENTVKGLRGKVTAEEATNITVANKNLLVVETPKGTSFNIEDVLLTIINSNEISLVGTKSEGSAWTGFSLNSIPRLKNEKTYTLSIHVFDTNTGEEITTSEEQAQGQINIKCFQNSSHLQSFKISGLYSHSVNIVSEVDFEDLTSITFIVEALKDLEYNICVQIQLEEAETATDYIEHQEQTYENVTEAEITTYDDITYIYNLDYIEMNAEIRIKS